MSSAAPIAEDVHLAMFAPDRDQCGISDYSRRLIHELHSLGGIELVRCADPPRLTPVSHLHAIASYAAIADRYREIGTSLCAPRVQIVHVQHEFSLFGGAAPHRNQAAGFYASVSTPIVVTVHEIAAEQGGALRRAALRGANRANFLHPNIHAWIVHTEHDRERLADIGVQVQAIHVVPIGIPEIVTLPDAESARLSLGLTNERVLTLFGFLSSKKGHFQALDAIEQMPADCILFFAGGRHPDDKTDYVVRLEAEIRRRQLTDRVRITGFLEPEQLPNVLAATDAALAPYEFSSGSASVAQLLAAGIPVITSDIPAFQEIAKTAPDAIRVASNAPALAAELQTLLNSTVQRDAMRDAARSYAAANTYRVMAERTLNVYRTVAGARSER